MLAVINEPLVRVSEIVLGDISYSPTNI